MEEKDTKGRGKEGRRREGNKNTQTGAGQGPQSH